MTQQTKLYEAAMALIGDLINRRSHFNSFQNLCRVLCEYEQSIEQPEATDCVCGIPTPDADRECCTICGHLIHAEEQPEAIAGEKTIEETDAHKYAEHRWMQSQGEFSFRDFMEGVDFASQQTSAKDKEIAELKEAISELIQVKDWKDKYGKDEHYLKSMPIAWENVRKLIQK